MPPIPVARWRFQGRCSGWDVQATKMPPAVITSIVTLCRSVMLAQLFQSHCMRSSHQTAWAQRIPTMPDLGMSGVRLWALA